MTNFMQKNGNLPYYILMTFLSLCMVAFILSFLQVEKKKVVETKKQYNTYSMGYYIHSPLIGPVRIIPFASYEFKSFAATSAKGYFSNFVFELPEKDIPVPDWRSVD